MKTKEFHHIYYLFYYLLVNVEMSMFKRLFIYVGPGNPAPHGSWVYSKHTPKFEKINKISCKIKIYI